MSIELRHGPYQRVLADVSCDAIVRGYSRPGNLVCDPTAGGGTTLLAAAIEGRRAIGAELSYATAELAAERIAQGYTPATLLERAMQPEQEGSVPLSVQQPLPPEIATERLRALLAIEEDATRALERCAGQAERMGARVTRVALWSARWVVRVGIWVERKKGAS